MFLQTTMQEVQPATPLDCLVSTAQFAIAVSTSRAVTHCSEIYVESGSRYHFYPRHDIALLKQAMDERPFLAPRGSQDKQWDKVALALREVEISATGRSLRDRFNKLVKLFNSNDQRNLRKSGTEEEYEEREKLLTEIIEMQRSADTKKNEQRKKEEKDLQLGRQIRGGRPGVSEE